MSDVKSPTKIWNGQYAVQVEIFENEFVYLQEDMESVTKTSQPNPILFDTEENAMECASMWNTGKAVRYDPVGEV